MSLKLTIEPECVVLIIDDDRDDQELLEEALHEINVAIVCYKAGNGQEGMKLLLSGNIPMPEIIFVDLNMPRVNGRQFLHQIKDNKILQNIPVIVYSTSYDEHESNDLISAGAAHFLKKPTNYEELKTKLEPVIERFRCNKVH